MHPPHSIVHAFKSAAGLCVLLCSLLDYISYFVSQFLQLHLRGYLETNQGLYYNIYRYYAQFHVDRSLLMVVRNVMHFLNVKICNTHTHTYIYSLSHSYVGKDMLLCVFFLDTHGLNLESRVVLVSIVYLLFQRYSKKNVKGSRKIHRWRPHHMYIWVFSSLNVLLLMQLPAM